MAGGTYRNVSSLVVVPSAARGDFTGPDIPNPVYRGARFILDVTNGSSTGSFGITWKFQGKIVGTTKYYTFFSTLTTSTNKTIRWLMFPGASTLDNTTGYTRIKNDFLPPVWRVTSTNLGAGALNVTWSLTADLTV